MLLIKLLILVMNSGVSAQKGVASLSINCSTALLLLPWSKDQLLANQHCTYKTMTDCVYWLCLCLLSMTVSIDYDCVYWLWLLGVIHWTLFTQNTIGVTLEGVNKYCRCKSNIICQIQSQNLIPLQKYKFTVYQNNPFYIFLLKKCMLLLKKRNLYLEKL